MYKRQVQSYPFHQPERVFFNPFNTQEVWVTSFGNGMKMGTITSTATGIPDFGNKEDEVLLYPNPASDMITINSNEVSNTYTISDITGKVILKGSMNETSADINVSQLQNGTYILHLKNVMGVNSKKFVICK